MLSRRMGLLGFAAAAAMAIGGMGAASAFSASAGPDKAVTVAGGRRYDTRRGLFSGRELGSHKSGRRAAFGWTNRHQQRVAKKKRNQARHRRASRG